MKHGWLLIATVQAWSLSSFSEAFALPSVFSNLTLEQARAQAKKSGKIVVADFSAVWCAPCHEMEKTSWVDPTVVNWIKSNAIAVQVDVDKQKSVAQALNVMGYPTVIIFQPKQDKEYDRQTGYKSGKQLLSWFAEIKQGHTSFDLLQKQLAAVAGKGGQKEIIAQLEIAQQALASGKYPLATEHFEWLWKNMAKEVPQSLGARNSLVAGSIQRLVQMYPPAKTKFSKLRDEAQAVNIDDWMILNTVLGEDKKTLAWFDSVKNQKAKKPELNKLSESFKMFLIENDRFADVGNLYQDPMVQLAKYQKISQVAQKMRPGSNLFAKQSALLYACLYAANRMDEANKVKTESFKLDKSPEIHSLFDQATKVGQEAREPKTASKASK